MKNLTPSIDERVLATVRLSVDHALAWIEQLEAFPVRTVDASLLELGVEMSRRFRISDRDGAILAAAQLSGATTLFSEALDHGNPTASYG